MDEKEALSELEKKRIDQMVDANKLPLLLAMASITLEEAQKFDSQTEEWIRSVVKDFESDKLIVSFNRFVTLCMAVGRLFQVKNLTIEHINIAFKTQEILMKFKGDET